MLRITYSELAGDKYGSALDADRRLIGSYPKLLREVLNDSLTKTQKRYIMDYYSSGLSINEIARRYGVNKSTVSRTINRGRERLRRAVKVELLKKALKDEPGG